MAIPVAAVRRRFQERQRASQLCRPISPELCAVGQLGQVGRGTQVTAWDVVVWSVRVSWTAAGGIMAGLLSLFFLSATTERKKDTKNSMCGIDIGGSLLGFS